MSKLEWFFALPIVHVFYDFFSTAYVHVCTCRCLKDVNDRIESLKQPSESDKLQYDDHTLFMQEYDEQLLLWTQRYNIIMNTCQPTENF